MADVIDLGHPPSAPARAEQESLYSGYVAFKRWSGAASTHEDAAFAIELRRAGITPPADVLEIGFGDGRFLDWGRAHGLRMCGVELIDELVQRARARGHDALLGRAETALDPSRRRFDLIVAFDVFEHMTAPELAALLGFARLLLKPQGRIIARFPNGGSPFGAYYQAGDVTHVTALTGTSMRQVAAIAGLRVVATRNAARVLGSGRGRLGRRARNLVRDMVELLAARIYFGHRVPLDPMLTVVLAAADG